MKFLHKNNFNLLRLCAALSVVFSHSYALSNGVDHGEDFISNFLIKYFNFSFASLGVNIFFVISGYLITASYINRNNFIEFYKARILRIYPALFVNIIFCILIGAIVTNYNIRQYFNSKDTFYFLYQNILLLKGIRFNLPGVFLDNPYPVSVNGSLWTLPIELYLYIAISIFGIISILKKKYFNIFLFLLFVSTFFNKLILLSGMNIRHIELVLYFFSGSYFYLNQNLFKLKFKYFILILIAIIILLFPSVFQLKVLWLSYIVILFGTYNKLIINKFTSNYDLSYGIYIYAFPVQQLIAHYFLGISFLNMLIASLVLTILLAFLSWNFIEKPFLSMK